MPIALRPPGAVWGEPEYYLIRDEESGSLAAAASWKHLQDGYEVRCATTVRTPRLGNGFERCPAGNGVRALAWLYSAWTHDPQVQASAFLPRLGSSGIWTSRPGTQQRGLRNEVLTYTDHEGLRLQAYSIGIDRHVVVGVPAKAPFLEWLESAA